MIIVECINFKINLKTESGRTGSKKKPAVVKNNNITIAQDRVEYKIRESNRYASYDATNAKQTCTHLFDSLLSHVNEKELFPLNSNKHE